MLLKVIPLQIILPFREPDFALDWGGIKDRNIRTSRFLEPEIEKPGNSGSTAGQRTRKISIRFMGWKVQILLNYVASELFVEESTTPEVCFQYLSYQPCFIISDGRQPETAPVCHEENKIGTKARQAAFRIQYFLIDRTIQTFIKLGLNPVAKTQGAQNWNQKTGGARGKECNPHFSKARVCAARNFTNQFAGAGEKRITRHRQQGAAQDGSRLI